MNQDIDPTTPLPSSRSKRPADSPASSSTEKRAKILLSMEELSQLTTLSSMMDGHRKKLQAVQEAGLEWPEIIELILMYLWRGSKSMNMKASVIANLIPDRADVIVKSLNEDELKEWKDSVRDGIDKNHWIGLLMCLQLKIQKMQNTTPRFEPSHEQEKATKASWEREYNGEAAQALWTHIQNHYDPGSSNRIYAHFCSIVQSSGMGKSRTVDELGKEHFSIPINLRDARSTGYPPADHEARDFLAAKDTEAKSYRRACCFIDALFQHTYNTLEEKFNSQWGVQTVAQEFRMRMTAGQKMKNHNEFRIQFYRRVVQIAKELMAKDVPHFESDSGPVYTSHQIGSISSSTDYNFPPAISCDKLVNSLQVREQHLSSSPVKKNTTSKARRVPGKTEVVYPLVILAFDEAHTLTNREDDGDTTWSNFSVLRHVLRALYRFPLFALFLSTTGKISQFTSPNEDTSGRIIIGDLTSIQPFTDLGFDTLAKEVAIVALDGHWNLERVTADSHIVHMGRPLFGARYDAGDRSVREDIVMFAVGKLLNADPNTQDFTQDQMLACLSQRLPIQFQSTTYISQTAERKQVEGHLRVCLKIDAVFQSMETVSSSEPLLSEAAYAIMARKSFDPLKSFKSLLEEFAVHKGDRGEFLALLLLTLARDQAVGPPDNNGRPACRFLSFASFVCGHLFKESPLVSGLENLQNLKNDFPDAMMHFNHFIKLHDFKSIDKECLLLLMSRGAGVLCANSQTSIDAANVFLCSGTTLTTNNFGLMLQQYKNNPDYTHIPKLKLFESMDPYDLGILKASDAPVPLIRIFFALAAKTPSLHVYKQEPSPTYNAVVYNIWSAGLSSDFLNPIDPQSDVWDGLLQVSYGWESIYKAPTNVAKELRRSMNPGAANDGGHWSRWSGRV